METRDGNHTTYLWIAETVIRRHNRPLNVGQIIALGLDDGLFADLDISRTPQKSMQARLSIDILNKGDRSRFVRTEPGKFYLRDLLKSQSFASDDQRALSEYTAVRRAPTLPSELVLVIEKSLYKNVLNFQGINVNYAIILEKLKETGGLRYIRRTDAEVNPDYKQLVTYTIIQHRDSILAFKRGQYNNVASFLRGSLCAGFGGHVTEDDLNIFSFPDRGITTNAAREISEEISFGLTAPEIDPHELELLGFLNDDSSDVGVRHVAAVLRYWVPNAAEWKKPQRGEASVTQLRWMKTSDIKTHLLEFEYWSQLTLRTFFSASTKSQPSLKMVRPYVFKEPHLLCVSGSIGSGKSITTKRLCEHAGYHQVNTGEIIASLLDIPSVPTTPRETFQVEAFKFISQDDGPRLLANAIINAVDEIGERRVIVDGIRQIRTLELLKSSSARRVTTLFIHTPPDMAYTFYSARENTTPDLSLSDFMRIYNAPVEAEVRFLIKDADAVIYNWFGREEYENVIEQLIRELGGK